MHKTAPYSRKGYRRRVGYAAVVLAAAAGWAAMNGTFASAVTAAYAGDKCTSASPSAGCHFVQVSDRGAPEYEAEATLYDAQGNVVYQWGEDHLGANPGPTWWFIDGNGGSLDVTVHGDNGIPGGDTKEQKGLSLDRDYCFHVDPLGYVKYTGDSTTGGCTKD